MSAPKIFKNEKTATAALKREGIFGMSHEFQTHSSAAGTGVIVVIYVDNSDDIKDVRARGFVPEYDPSKAAQ